MLANLLPGVRELRAPLAAGYLWLLLAWLLFEDDLVSAAGRGAYEPLVKLGPITQGFGVTVVVSFVAYLVGSLAVSAIPRVHRPHPLRPKSFAPEVPQGMSMQGWSNLKLWSGEAIRRVLARLEKEQGVAKVDALKRYLDPMALDADAQAYAVARNDFALVKTQLLTKAEKLYSEVDRKESEAGLRFAIVPPLAGLAGYLMVADSPVWAGAAVPVLALLYQGRKFEREASDTLVTVLRATPDLESPAVLHLEYRLRRAIPDLAADGELSGELANQPGILRSLAERIRDYDRTLFDVPVLPIRVAARNRVAGVWQQLRSRPELASHVSRYLPMGARPEDLVLRWAPPDDSDGSLDLRDPHALDHTADRLVEFADRLERGLREAERDGAQADRV